MLRGGWEQKIGRPLTLVVVDEAHGLASKARGLKLELLLATINRECRYAQFLLLTPFIHNAVEIARWLSPDSNKNIELAVDRSPNDRVIAIARPVRGDQPGDFGVRLVTRHTTRNTINLPESLDIGERRPLGLSCLGLLFPDRPASLRQRPPRSCNVGAPSLCWSTSPGTAAARSRA